MPNDAKRLGARHTKTRALAACAAMMVGVTGAFAQADEPIKPIPLNANSDARKVALGDRLFHDRRLSKDNTLSCASCHDLAQGWRRRPGVVDRHRRRQGPDQRADGVQQRAQLPPVLGRPRRLARGAGCRPGAQPEGDGQQLARGARQAVAGHRTGRRSSRPPIPTGCSRRTSRTRSPPSSARSTTPNARFDKYLRGDKAALSADEQRGYQLFKSYGCIACHQGVNVGGNMFQTFGVMGDYFAKRGKSAGRPGPLQRDQERGRQARVQGAEPAQHRADGAVLPRRLGGRRCPTRST